MYHNNIIINILAMCVCYCTCALHPYAELVIIQCRGINTMIDAQSHFCRHLSTPKIADSMPNFAPVLNYNQNQSFQPRTMEFNLSSSI